MSSTMDKLKDKLHIRRKSQSEEAAFPPGTHASDGTSFLLGAVTNVFICSAGAVPMCGRA